MSLPLLGTDFLTSPTMNGVVPSKTADLLAASGAQLAKDIERRSYEDEAKILAPKVTQSYATAYQKIAQGDFTGFADMQQARTIAIGNPILMKTMDDADKLAGHLAGEWMNTTRTAMNIDSHERIADKQIDKTYDLEEGRDRRFDEREKRLVNQSRETQARTLYSQEYANWERENFMGQKAYDDAMRLYEKRMDIYNQQKKLGDPDAKAPEKPQPWTPRPKPKLEDFMQQMGVTAGGGDSEDIIRVPSTTVSPNVTGDTPPLTAAPSAPLSPAARSIPPFKEGPRVARNPPAEPPLPSGGTPLFDMTDTPAPEVRPAAAVEVRPAESREQAMAKALALAEAEAGTGAATPAVKPDFRAGMAARGAATTTPTPAAPKADELAPDGMPVDLSSKLEAMTPPPIAQQVAAKVENGEEPKGLTFGFHPKVGTSLDITVNPTGYKKKSITVDTEKGESKITYEPNEDGKKAVELVSYFENKENLAAWIGLQQTLGHRVEATAQDPSNPKNKAIVFRTGTETFSDRTVDANGVETKKPVLYTEDDKKKWDEMEALVRKGVISVKPNKVPKELSPYMRQQAIADILTKPDASLAVANSQLEKLGVEKVTEAEVKAAKAKAEEAARAPQNAEWQRRVDTELRKQGFELPNDAQPVDEAGQLRKVADENKAKMEDIDKQIAVLKQKTGGKPNADQVEELRRLQAARIVAHDKHWDAMTTLMRKSSMENPVWGGG